MTRTLTMQETAAEFRVSRRWLQDFIARNPIPYLQAGRKKLFDEVALNAIREAMRRPVDPFPRTRAVRHTSMSPRWNTGSSLAEALRLLDEKTPRSSSRSGARRRNVVPSGGPNGKL
jgi:Helix-turn-helix domain